MNVLMVNQDDSKDADATALILAKAGHAPRSASAVHMYQMPLANRIKAMRHAHFVFTPISAPNLKDRLRMLTTNTEQQP